MVAHGASRGRLWQVSISPEGDTSNDAPRSSTYRPPGYGEQFSTQPTACAVGYHLPPSGLKRQSLPLSGYRCRSNVLNESA